MTFKKMKWLQFYFQPGEKITDEEVQSISNIYKFKNFGKLLYVII